MGLAVLLPAIQWYGYLKVFFSLSEEYLGPGGWRKIYDFENPEFVEGFTSGVEMAMKFWDSFGWLSAFEIVGLFLTLAIAFVLWRSAVWYSLPLIGYSLLCALPALFGLSLIPAWLVTNSALLAETGLSDHPLAVGAGTGESVAPLWIGTLFSLVLVVGMYATRPKEERSETGAEDIHSERPVDESA